MRTRNKGASLVAVLVVVVMVSVMGAGLVSMTSNQWHSTPLALTSAQSFYSAESGMAVANKLQAGTGAPVTFENGSWNTTKAGNTYTTTVTSGGKVVRVLTGSITPPDDGDEGGPLDEAAAAATATTASFYTPGPGWVDGDSEKQLVMKLVNTTGAPLQVVAFSVSSTGAQPKVKELRFRTAANDWDEARVWKEGDGVSVPTGRIDLDEGDPDDDWTIPANSFIVVEELEFKGDIDPEEDITVTFFFSDGSQSDIVFKILNDEDVPANPLDEAASQATVVNDGNLTDNPSPPGAGSVSAQDEEIVLKLINESDVNLTIQSFSLSCTTSQPKIEKLELATPGNQWDSSATVWDNGSGVSLPTGTITLDEGDPAEDYVIPAGSYVIVNDMIFKDDVNPGTFTLVINFRGGESSTLTFTVP